jgi:hypothetical protein
MITLTLRIRAVLTQKRMLRKPESPKMRTTRKLTEPHRRRHVAAILVVALRRRMRCAKVGDHKGRPYRRQYSRTLNPFRIAEAID